MQALRVTETTLFDSKNAITGTKAWVAFRVCVRDADQPEGSTHDVSTRQSDVRILM